MKPALRILLSIGLAAAISYVCFSRGMSTLATMLLTIPIVVLVRIAIALTIDKDDLP